MLMNCDRTDNQTKTACIAISRSTFPLVGLSIHESTTNKIEIFEFTDNWSFHILIQRLKIDSVNKIIISENQNVLENILHKEVQESDIIILPRNNFEEDIDSLILENLKNNFNIESLRDKHFTLSSLSALYKFLDKNINSCFLEYILLDQFMFISQKTIEDLEIFKSKDNKGPTLYGLLKNTKTKMGEKLLKYNLAQPLLDTNEITNRHDLIIFFSENQIVFHTLEKYFKSLVDIDQIINFLYKERSDSNYEYDVGCCVKLNSLFNIIEGIKSFYQKYESKEILTKNLILKDFFNIIFRPEISEIINSINKIFDRTALYSHNTQENISSCIKIIRNGVDTKLDISRQIYSENLNDLYEILSDYESKYSLSINLVFDTAKGYLFKIKSDEFKIIEDNFYKDIYKNQNDDIIREDPFSIQNASTEFILISRKKGFILFTSVEVQKINLRIKDSYLQVMEISSKIFEFSKKKIFSFLEIFHILGNIIGLVDLVISFYIFTKKYKCCIPEFGDSLIVTESHHPFFTAKNSILNSFYCCPDLNFNIITGTNMSGKTTYVKHIALICIMGQIGCPIIGKYASLKPFKNILTRLNSEDNMEMNLSSFAVELLDIKNILDFSDSNSLIIIDELGRSTSYLDSISFSVVVSKYLVFKKSFTYFITHFNEIILCLKKYQNVNVLKNCNFKVTSGINKIINGIEIASKFLNPKIINDSLEIKRNISCFNSGTVDTFQNSEIQLALQINKTKNKEKALEEIFKARK
ncbi:MutS protein msh4 [Hamiltosporidium tvaerminnensis]|nr:MutS protein msh4 [Hamiltosporidium tvaerminnensis]